MVLVTSVFFVQLLCALVPCNPNYPVPDLSQDPRHSDTNHIRSTLESHFFKRLWPWSTESHPSPPHPLIPTEGGLVQGYKIRVVGSREVHAWQGIPYGEPPTGHLRFKVGGFWIKWISQALIFAFLNKLLSYSRHYQKLLGPEYSTPFLQDHPVFSTMFQRDSVSLGRRIVSVLTFIRHRWADKSVKWLHTWDYL